MAGLDREILEFLFVGPLFSIFKKLNAIERKVQDMATQADVDALTSKVQGIAAQQVKAQGEVVTEFGKLRDQIANLPTPVELDLGPLGTAIDNAASGAQALDDINPDVAEPETPSEPEAPVDPSTVPVDEIPATPVEDA